MARPAPRAAVPKTAPIPRPEEGRTLRSPAASAGHEVMDSVLPYAPGSAEPFSPVVTPPPDRAPEQPPGQAVTEQEALHNATLALRLAIEDVTRLGIVANHREAAPGRLVLTVDEGYRTSSSLAYNLTRLYAAYVQYLGYPDEDPTVELWENGVKIGEVTRQGLQFRTEPSTTP